VCPPGPRTDELHDVGGGGDRPGAHADLAGAQLRFGVHGEDVAHALQRASADHVGGAAVQDLLGGLEDAAHPLLQPVLPVVLGERAGQPQDHRGVDVVPAGVHHPGGARREVQAGGLRERQGVDVRPEGDRRRPRLSPDVDGDPGAGQPTRREPGVREPVDDELRGPGLLVGQFRVGVEMAAPPDHGVVVVDSPGGDGVNHRDGVGGTKSAH
jgi:hypothetical protein